jgi:hypothetical protein
LSQPHAPLFRRHEIKPLRRHEIKPRLTIGAPALYAASIEERIMLS